jgi:hypothetical protein
MTSMPSRPGIAIVGARPPALVIAHMHEDFERLVFNIAADVSGYTNPC